MRAVVATVLISAVALVSQAQLIRDTPTSPSRGPVERGFQPQPTATLKASPYVGHHQQRPPDEITITGRVVADDTGDAVPNARVTLTTTAQGTPVVLTVPIDFDLSPPNNLATANIRSDWSFEIAGVNGPRRLQLTRAPSGWAFGP